MISLFYSAHLLFRSLSLFLFIFLSVSVSFSLSLSLSVYLSLPLSLYHSSFISILLAVEFCIIFGWTFIFL